MIILKHLYEWFAGGGTDLPNYYKNVMEWYIYINSKFIYVIVRKQVGFLDYKFKLIGVKLI